MPHSFQYCPTHYINFYTGEFYLLIGTGSHAETNEEYCITMNPKQEFTLFPKHSFMLFAVDDASVPQGAKRRKAELITNEFQYKDGAFNVFGRGFINQTDAECFLTVNKNGEIVIIPVSQELENRMLS